MTRTALLRDGTILNDRYRIVRQIGRGGFGRTYLAEDTQRFRELCVLKEFAPQVESDGDLRKAEELFEREAGILYSLKHDRIPRFEALLRTRIAGKNSLFLVQQYIEGKSYWEILKYENKLTEADVTELVWELLPVLEYIHSQNLIHRDISPDNLIRREADGKPVLIDFGCVKIAANAVSKSTGRGVTLIGKKGYSPQEQMQSGQAYPCSDLYSLAATVLVLLTRKQPHELYDHQQGKWNWSSEVEISPAFARIINKMLAHKPRDRYQSVAQLRQALETAKDSLVSNLISRLRTLVVAPKNVSAANEAAPVSQRLLRRADWKGAPAPNPSFVTDRGVRGGSRLPTSLREGESLQRLTEPALTVGQAVALVRSRVWQIATDATAFSRQATLIPSPRELRKLKLWHWGLIVSGVIFLPGIISFAVLKDNLDTPSTTLISNNSAVSLGKREQQRQQKIYQRILDLGLEPGAFFRDVDEEFHRQYPELQGIQLTDKSEHKQYRSIWYDIAVNLLERRETSAIE